MNFLIHIERISLRIEHKQGVFNDEDKEKVKV